MGESHPDHPELKRIIENDDVVVDYSGSRLANEGMGVDMILDGLIGSVWVSYFLLFSNLSPQSYSNEKEKS